MPRLIPKHIRALGFELEGGWTTQKVMGIKEKGKKTLKLGTDGSVSVGDNDFTGPGAVEWCTKAGEVRGERPFFTLETAKEAFYLGYPTHVNYTCGFHIHLSFPSMLHYRRFVCQDFFDRTYAFWTAWGDTNKEALIADGGQTQELFWRRLGGQNAYCKKEYCPERQIDYLEKDGNRYCGLNYCWGRFKTIELRLLPMFRSPDLAWKALCDWVQFVESYSKEHPVQRCPARDATIKHRVVIPLPSTLRHSDSHSRCFTGPDKREDHRAFVATLPTPETSHFTFTGVYTCASL